MLSRPGDLFIYVLLNTGMSILAAFLIGVLFFGIPFVFFAAVYIVVAISAGLSVAGNDTIASIALFFPILIPVLLIIAAFSLCSVVVFLTANFYWHYKGKPVHKLFLKTFLNTIEILNYWGYEEMDSFQKRFENGLRSILIMPLMVLTFFLMGVSSFTVPGLDEPIVLVAFIVVAGFIRGVFLSIFEVLQPGADKLFEDLCEYSPTFYKEKLDGLLRKWEAGKRSKLLKKDIIFCYEVLKDKKKVLDWQGRSL